MKKILILSLLSTCVMFCSLWYVDSVILSDSSITFAQHKEVVLTDNSAVVGYLPENYSAFSFSKTLDKAVFTANNLMYLADIESESVKILNTDSFVQTCSFLNDSSIIYTSINGKEVNINVFDLLTNKCSILGSLSYSNFISLDNARIVDNKMLFDIRYRNNEDILSRSYVFDNNVISRISSNDYYTNNCLIVNDNRIVTTNENKTYINDSLFSYNDTTSYNLIGKDIKNVVYLHATEHNNKVISMSISDNIDITEEYTLDSIEYNHFFCSDTLYLIGDKFALDLEHGVKINLEKSGNILYINNNTILHEENGVLYKQKY